MPDLLGVDVCFCTSTSPHLQIEAFVDPWGELLPQPDMTPLVNVNDQVDRPKSRSAMFETRDTGLGYAAMRRVSGSFVRLRRC